MFIREDNIGVTRPKPNLLPVGEILVPGRTPQGVGL